ncbi:MAG: hypothetical protein ACOWWM_05760 [Desulfobacterales bacterium]
MNFHLNGLRVASDVNEKEIEDCLARLEKADASDSPLYWLTMVRLAEMAILCAGNYADNCEFSAAADLMVNPRLIHVHLKGRLDPIAKNRHGRLSLQLGLDRVPVSRQSPVVVAVESVLPPLIPYLMSEMKASGSIRETYLGTITRRMKKIADTMSFLAAGSIFSAEQLYRRLGGCSPREKRFLEGNLCRFDSTLLGQAEKEIRSLGSNSYRSSRFLIQDRFVPRVDVSY